MPYSENTGGVICDLHKWTQVSGSFTSQGGERHFIIGNFYKDSLTTVLNCHTGNHNPNIGVVILIDDVSVWPCDAPVYEADAGRNQQICYWG
jgi:hypothetical protein